MSRLQLQGPKSCSPGKEEEWSGGVKRLFFNILSLPLALSQPGCHLSFVPWSWIFSPQNFLPSSKPILRSLLEAVPVWYRELVTLHACHCPFKERIVLLHYKEKRKRKRILILKSSNSTLKCTMPHRTPQGLLSSYGHQTLQLIYLRHRDGQLKRLQPPFQLCSVLLTLNLLSCSLLLTS